MGQAKPEWATDELHFGEDTNAELQKWLKESKELATKQNRDYAMVPNQHENVLKKARMVTFEQLYDFNNLFLNKSFLKKRMQMGEDNIKKLQEEMVEMHEWRDRY